MNAHKHHILLADPEIQNLHTLQFLLESENYDVQTAQNEQEFTQRLKTMPVVDLIISGLQRTQHILKQVFGGLRVAPILLVTNYKPDTAEKGSSIQKPFSAQLFLERVRHLVNQQTTFNIT